MSARSERMTIHNMEVFNPVKEGAERAKLLDRVGMNVWLEKDDGKVVPTKTRSVPWQLGHGAWVVMVDGIAGGYDILRVTPRPLKEGM